ncbi:hypothetical protein MNEG_10040 [Monoraphidium neglectum]|uniref:RUNKEL ARM-repeat domain-containing protein n=1 Tax=Monoraphidium neglectum TaxID=145388 RepID=A0A0D2M2R5_9CHLO|nr:hypothetical protein MNEG_10040 [Monoraphidium neglectum]KIY97924.1 hypothetical protein MNEG_10040 [Monoraphidium neglectum]|eukprot:XP_013896944.1 hypothetical protein MNEG_10040 [Monoraphidium neglectum]
MPLYALKLLGGVLEVNSGFVGQVRALGLAPLFFDYLSLEHANNNVHNIRLCRALVMAGGMGAAQLQALGAADKVCAVLQYAHHNNVEPFLEPVLDLCGAIMAGDAREVAGGSSQGEVLAVFLQQLPVFMDLCSHPEAPVAVAASQCLAELVSLYPQETAGWVLSNDGAAILAAALRGLHLEGDAAPPPRMQQHVLAAVNAALAADPSVGTSSAELDQLLTALRELEASGEGVVRDAAAVVADLLANAAGR